MPNLKIEYDGEREKERNRGGGEEHYMTELEWAEKKYLPA